MKCTYCGSTKFYEGPSGGMSTNVLCANPECRHWFNHAPALDFFEDLNRVEPTPEEKAERRTADAAAFDLGIENRMKEGREAYRLGQRIGACGGSNANGGFYSEDKTKTNLRRGMAYGGYAEPLVNVDRMAGFIEAMADDIRALLRRK